MRKLILITFCILLVSCASKSTPIDEKLSSDQKVENTAPVEIEQDEQRPVLPIRAPERGTSEFITVISTGFGSNDSTALESAKEDAVVAAADIILSNGDAYICDITKIITHLAPQQAEYVADTKSISKKQQASGDIVIEAVSKVNYTRLAEAINALNAVSYRVTDSYNLRSAIAEQQKKQERLLKQFESIFGDLNDVISVKVITLDFDHGQAKDGLVAFRIEFEFGADETKYNQKAHQMIDIITNELGGSYVKSFKVDHTLPSRSDQERFSVPMKYFPPEIDEYSYATIISRNGKDVLEVYSIGRDYVNFYNRAYLDRKVIGNPYEIQLYIKLSDHNSNILYEDYFKPVTTINVDLPKASDLDGTYPAVYMVLKNEFKSEYNGRFRIHTDNGRIYGMIFQQGSSLNPNYVGERWAARYPEKLAITSPYMNYSLRHGGGISTARTMTLHYEGLIQTEDVKKLKSVTIDVVR